jgi:hypothetical protein
MWPSFKDAVEMYASFLIARHGSGASGYARKTAGSLENEGDHEGHEIWNEVADIITDANPTKCHAAVLKLLFSDRGKVPSSPSGPLRPLLDLREQRATFMVSI